jgi:hypothetical protein
MVHHMPKTLAACQSELWWQDHLEVKLKVRLLSPPRLHNFLRQLSQVLGLRLQQRRQAPANRHGGAETQVGIRPRLLK